MVRLLAFLIRAGGWLALLAGVALFTVFVINSSGYVIQDFQFGGTHMDFNRWPARVWIRLLLGGVAAVGVGGFMAAMVDIERNTRQSARNMEILWRVMHHH